MSAKDKSETGKAPANRELTPDEIDSVSGGVGSKPTTGWVEPDPNPLQAPTNPVGWIDPEPTPKR